MRPFTAMTESASISGWELFAALMFHNLTIIISAWIGFVIGRRTLELDEMEKFITRTNGIDAT